MVDKAKFVKGIVTLGIIIWFLFQVYAFGLKLRRKDTGTLESLQVEKSVQYPSIAICPRPHAKRNYTGAKFPMPEDYNTCLLEFKSCTKTDGMKDKLRNRIIFTPYGNFKTCALLEPTSMCHPGNFEKVQCLISAVFFFHSNQLR